MFCLGSSFVSAPEADSPPKPPPRATYPNPGYMGASSHVAIFSHISRNSDVLDDAGSTAGSDGAASAVRLSLLDSEGEMQAAKVAGRLAQLLSKFDAGSLRQLVGFWRATGVNLALAEPLVDTCQHALEDLQAMHSSNPTDGNLCLAYVRRLLHNSIQPLVIEPSLDLHSFCLQFLHSNTRLETIGLLFCAIIRAVSEVYMFPPLYIDNMRRQELLSQAVKFTNIIVEVILSLDNLHDLQLIMQYENFVSHSFVFGVQCM
jgi:hypothetical protein